MNMHQRLQGCAVHGLVSQLEMYAQHHAALYEHTILEDYVLGPAFENMVRGARVLLNGETGTQDCAALDARLLALLPEGER